MSMPTILLVDDIKLFQEVEREFLKESNVSVLTADNGSEALSIIKNKRPDLIFMDQRMPVMDGTACCSTLKADPDLKNIPVVMVIASTRDEDITECRNTGCDEILFKPIERKIFLEVGRKFLPAIDRREKRVPCKTMVVLRKEEKVYHSVSKDISEHGMFVEFNHQVKENDKVYISFVLPGTAARLIEVFGRITWVNNPSLPTNPSSPRGFGMEFLQITEESTLSIQEYVRNS